VDVFTAMKGSSEALPDAGDAKAVKAYFQQVYPDMDFERVYGSDMKKVIKWYNQLLSHNIEIKLSENPEHDDNAHEAIVPKAKAAEPKQVTTKAAPPKKINSPRKMA
jgi:hypothetical protein